MIALAAIIALALLILRRSHTETQHPSDSAMPSSESETAQSPPAMEAESQDKAVSTVLGIFSAPIEFYGRVMDQHREPVVDAEVEFGAANNFMEPSTKYSARSDGNGYFSITGIQGAALNISISKDGYGRITDVSSQSFGYGMGPDSNRKVPPKKDNPAIFVLRKMAVPEPLIAIDADVVLPKDGTPVEVSLTTGDRVAALLLLRLLEVQIRLIVGMLGAGFAFQQIADGEQLHAGEFLPVRAFVKSCARRVLHHAARGFFQ